MSTPAYDLSDDLIYEKYEDKVARQIKRTYDSEKKSITVESEIALNKSVFFFVYSDAGELLIKDQINAPSKSFFRVYNLKGASARTVEIIAEMGGITLLKERFDFWRITLLSASI